MRLNDEAENALDASEVNTEEKADSAAPDGNDTNAEELASKQDVFAIDDKPGFGLLSSKEKELCKRIRLFPQHYLDVKKALISESLAAGIWDPSSKAQKGKTFVTVDVSKRDDIIDFVLKAGWISSRPTVSTVGEKGGGS
jgi:transcriptional adapter 2-alpha